MRFFVCITLNPFLWYNNAWFVSWLNIKKICLGFCGWAAGFTYSRIIGCGFPAKTNHSPYTPTHYVLSFDLICF
ncbi:hypothetical protein [Helicobacter bilis]|uniref:hypothetical protein n=1 Tax=Helicobacter bilis TaxID=37372 RepID=UPI001431E506|nr:hypothetical protein [Helicobacter bilis]